MNLVLSAVARQALNLASSGCDDAVVTAADDDGGVEAEVGTGRDWPSLARRMSGTPGADGAEVDWVWVDGWEEDGVRRRACFEVSGMRWGYGRMGHGETDHCDCG